MATWPSSLGNPQFSGYDLETTDPTVRTDMEGGAARVRRRYTSAPDTVSLKFLFDAAQMATFRAFWDYDLMNGAAWAYMPVKTGRVSGMEAKECRPIAGKFKAVPAGSRHWYVEFQVEVRRGVYLWYDTINAMKLPSLELDFGGTKSLNSVLTTSAQPSVSVEFSRASEGTYYGADGLLKTAGANEARFDFDPITLACKGLLIEEARTNLVLNSESMTGSIGTLVTPNAIAAPDGSITADFAYEDTSTGEHFICERHANLTAGTVYCWSVFVKDGPSANRLARLRIGDIANANFNPRTKTITGSYGSGYVASGFEELSNGYFRFWIAATAAVTGSLFFRVHIEIPGTTYTGDGVSGLYVWGMQLEAGTFPTSYIPTTSAAATRAADIAQMTGANFSSWYRQDEGAVIVRGDSNASWYSTAGQIVNISNNSTQEANVIQRLAALNCSYAVNVGGVSVVSISKDVIPTGDSFTIAGAYKLNDYGCSQNGDVASTDSIAPVPVVDRMFIGHRHDGTRYMSGHIAKLTYYPKRLDNATLQALTT